MTQLAVVLHCGATLSGGFIRNGCLLIYIYKDSMEYIWGGGVMQISSGVGDVMLRYVDGLIFDIQQSMVS